MKINRINAVIRRAENTHQPFLDNKITKLMNEHKFGGLYTNDRIELANMPETVTTILDKLKIVFERVKQ